jgi:hypothetical protein
LVKNKKENLPEINTIKWFFLPFTTLSLARNSKISLSFMLLIFCIHLQLSFWRIRFNKILLIKKKILIWVFERYNSLSSKNSIVVHYRASITPAITYAHQKSPRPCQQICQENNHVSKCETWHIEVDIVHLTNVVL